MRHFSLITLLLLIGCYSSFSATCTTTSTTTWSCVGGPGSNDDLIINHDITISGNFTVSNGSITVNAPNTLTITGDLIFDPNSTVLVANGAGIYVMGDFRNKNNSGDVEIFGTLIIDGDFENGTGSGNGAVIDVGGTGSISYGGSCSNAGTVEDDDGSYSGDCNNPVLPVELVNFRATAVETGNLLEWETASERDNDLFSIERSSDTRNWEAIAEVEGQGNSDQSVAYEFLDNQPPPGRVFYRLKQVDFDGAFEYSYIVSVITGELPQFLVRKVYPVPALDYLNVSFISNNDLPVYFQVVDLLGRELLNGSLENHVGSQTTRLDTASLSNGTYWLLMTNQQLTVTIKLIKTS